MLPLSKINQLLAILLLSISCTDAFRALILASNIGYSHLAYTGRLADLLVDAGHEVDYVVEVWHRSFQHNGSQKANVIRFEGKNTPKIEQVIMSISAWGDPFESEWDRAEMVKFGRMQALHCESILSDHTFLSYLRSRNYTVGMAESFDACAWAVFRMLGIRSIHELNAIALPETSAFIHGIPIDFRHVPVFFNTKLGRPMVSFLDTVYNLYEYLITRFYIPRIHSDQVNEVFHRLLGPNHPTLEKMQRHSDYIWVNTHEFVDFPRILSAKVKHIGGIAVKEPPTMNQDVAKIFEQARSGIVLVSYGSVVDTTKMRAQVRDEMLEAFSRFPDYDFIWRLTSVKDNATITAISKYPNVHAFEWVQQTAILAHPKTRGFVSHMGLNSLNEAAQFGVPLVAVPFFGDQMLNSAMATRRGFAVYVPRQTINNKTLSHALGEILHNERYRQTALDLKAKIANAPVKPIEIFIKHMEFAEKFGRLDELELDSASDSLVEQFNLDLIGAAILALLLAYKISRVTIVLLLGLLKRLAQCVIGRAVVSAKKRD